MKNEQIYLDHAATTPLRAEVLDSMMPFLTNDFGLCITAFPKTFQ